MSFRMPRYYFDATGGGRTLLDHEGDEFADASAAIAYGSQTAAQCCADRLARGFYPSDEGMRVRDSDGRSWLGSPIATRSSRCCRIG
jgi:hypothetical protein